MSAPAEEVRRASGPALHAVTHSCGLIATDGDPGDYAFSFAIRGHATAGGQPGRAPRVQEAGIVELGGWGFAGRVDVDQFGASGPPSALAVLTVHVDSVEPESLGYLRELIDQHAERYGECRVWVSIGSSRDLKAWVAAGCPPTGEAPSDDELAAAAEVHHGEDRQPTRRGPGWEVSEPIADEVDSTAVPPEEAQQAEEIAAARAQAHLDKQAGDVSEPLPANVTRQELRHRRSGAPGRPA